MLVAMLAAHLALSYEWIHYLTHTAYRPRSRLDRAIWRGHRLHHFKNERYWFGRSPGFLARLRPRMRA